MGVPVLLLDMRAGTGRWTTSAAGSYGVLGRGAPTLAGLPDDVRSSGPALHDALTWAVTDALVMPARGSTGPQAYVLRALVVGGLPGLTALRHTAGAVAASR